MSVSLQVGSDRPVDVGLLSASAGVDTCGSTRYLRSLERIGDDEVLLRSSLQVADVIVPAEQAVALERLLDQGHGTARAVLTIGASEPTDP